jgi:hypothetical protein
MSVPVTGEKEADTGWPEKKDNRIFPIRLSFCPRAIST